MTRQVKSDPVCFVIEVFDEDGNSLGYITCGEQVGFPVYVNPEVEREQYASQSATQNGLERWVDGKVSRFEIKTIEVGSEADKQQILIALKYLHDCCIDTDFIAVNNLVHLYHDPDLITVKSNG